MSHIFAKNIKSYDRNVLTIHINGIPLDKVLYNVTGNSTYNNLWCAWLLNDCDNDSRYIWTLLNEKRSCNLPILLCPDDMDFWCTVIIAQVRFSTNKVLWNKIGVVNKEIDIRSWCESGIKNTASWSDKDWEKYGSTLATLSTNDKAWERWWSENWSDEEKRRIWNYFHPYFNDDDNIEWLDLPAYIFEVNEYDACVSSFRQFEY